MSEDNTPYQDRLQVRRAVVARYGHFRVDRAWYRPKQPCDSTDSAHYAVCFEVDDGGEFDLGTFGGSRGGKTLSASDLRRFTSYLASLWRCAHSPPPETRPTSVPYYRRVGPDAVCSEGTPEEWLREEFAVRMPDQATIDVDEAAALIGAAMHELDASEIKGERFPGL